MWLLNVHIFMAALWLVCGLVGGVCFASVFHNYTTACWGVVSALFAGLTLGLHLKQKYGTFDGWHRRLKWLMLVGCIGQLAGCSGMSSALSLAIVLGTPALQVYGENQWLALVWSFMTWKWSFLTFFYARKYKAIYKRLKNAKDASEP